MAHKCAITKQKIPELFLGKINGTIIKDKDGKKYYISAEAQKTYKNNKEKLLSVILGS